jgi:hypothetical protein
MKKSDLQDLKNGGQQKSLNAYLTLQDVRSVQNRYRSYLIKIETINIRNRYHYAIKLAWGRIGGNKRVLSYVCNSLDEVKSLLKPILRTRLRHGYRLIDKSENFPEYEILKEFQKGSVVGSTQLLLFD